MSDRQVAARGRRHSAQIAVRALPHRRREVSCAYYHMAVKHAIVGSCQEGTMNRDQVKGRIDQVKGKAKKAAGKAVGNRDLERKGKVQSAGGKVRSTYGDLKEDIKKLRKST